MKKVIVYVEGPSDRLAMQELLADLLTQLQTVGIAVEFIPTEGKRRLMLQTPIKAANILGYDPHAVVIALPDLYPPNFVLDHTTFDELAQALQQEFKSALARKRLTDRQLHDRFHVFCFKHDLEALVLAAESQLASRLGVQSVTPTWAKPVENQDHNVPPKRIVEQIFQAHGDKYRDTIDAPLILGAARYSEIADACPQCFKPFVDYLESLLEKDTT
ncbi:MAG: DUF4276 family protein [Chloroflexi bacterium]|nr:DUF4276 family protein [Chloroflexota bacterium]